MTPLPQENRLFGKVAYPESWSGPDGPNPRSTSAFSRADLLFTVMALLLLLLVISKSNAGWREPGKQTLCANNLRQLATSLLMFGTENDDLFPRRASPAWPTTLLPFYKDTNVLVCPADTPVQYNLGRPPADNAPRSYIMNGWSDFYGGAPPPNAAPPGLMDIPEPQSTICFGEKLTESFHLWMDYWAGDDFLELELTRHAVQKSYDSTSRYKGGSNYAFVDGSVQLLGGAESLYPTNLWFIYLRTLPQ
jgi:prepilin-type processing-associated H-X9-DG protein